MVSYYSKLILRCYKHSKLLTQTSNTHYCEKKMKRLCFEKNFFFEKHQLSTTNTLISTPLVLDFAFCQMKAVTKKRTARESLKESIAEAEAKLRIEEEKLKLRKEEFAEAETKLMRLPILFREAKDSNEEYMLSLLEAQKKTVLGSVSRAEKGADEAMLQVSRINERISILNNRLLGASAKWCKLKKQINW
jgi:phage FluMu protein Com